jgi:hypothetical protein
MRWNAHHSNGRIELGIGAGWQRRIYTVWAVACIVSSSVTLGIFRSTNNDSTNSRVSIRCNECIQEFGTIESLKEHREN